MRSTVTLGGGRSPLSLANSFAMQTMQRITIFGSSGTVGTELLKELRPQNLEIRAAFHRNRPGLQGVHPVQVDLSNGTGLEDAVAGVDSVFLMMADIPEQAVAEIRVVKAAQRAKVDRIVKLSVLGAETEAFAFARVHRQIEREIEKSGMPYVFLRPGGFMQNFVNHYGKSIREESAFYLPCGDSSEAHIDARDIAAVSAKVLISPKYDGRAYDLTGSRSLTYHEASNHISAAIARPVKYVSITEEEFAGSMTSYGMSDSYIEGLLELYRFHRDGLAPKESSTVVDILGRDASSFERFAEDHANAWLI